MSDAVKGGDQLQESSGPRPGCGFYPGEGERVLRILNRGHTFKGDSGGHAEWLREAERRGRAGEEQGLMV